MLIMGLGCWKLKIHHNPPYFFPVSIGLILSLTAYNRYYSCLQVFNKLPILPDEKLEKERQQIIKDSFLLTYDIFVYNIEREYLDSKLGNEFRFKKL